MIGPLGPDRGDWALIGSLVPGLCSDYVTATQSRDLLAAMLDSLTAESADQSNSVGKLAIKHTSHTLSDSKIQCKGKLK